MVEKVIYRRSFMDKIVGKIGRSDFIRKVERNFCFLFIVFKGIRKGFFLFSFKNILKICF